MNTNPTKNELAQTVMILKEQRNEFREERDAAMAEVARLREALLEVARQPAGTAPRVLAGIAQQALLPPAIGNSSVSQAEYTVKWTRFGQPERSTTVVADDQGHAKSQVYVLAGCPIDIVSVARV